MSVKAELQESPAMAVVKGSTKAAKKSKSDLIVMTAHEIENLTKEKAYNKAVELNESVDFTYFQLGGVLSVIQSNAWFVEEGYESFKDFVEGTLGMKYRKAMYLVGIYNNLVESGVAWDKVKAIGWTKLKEIAHLLTDENVDEWVERANVMTTLQLQEYVKELEKGDMVEGGEVELDKTKVSTMTFKVHADQKEIIREALDKGKHEQGTEFDTVALESICMSYLNGYQTKEIVKEVQVTKEVPADNAPASLSDVMENAGWEEVLGQFEKLFPNIDLSVTVN